MDNLAQIMPLAIYRQSGTTEWIAWDVGARGCSTDLVVWLRAPTPHESLCLSQMLDPEGQEVFLHILMKLPVEGAFTDMARPARAGREAADHASL